MKINNKKRITKFILVISLLIVLITQYFKKNFVSNDSVKEKKTVAVTSEKKNETVKNVETVEKVAVVKAEEKKYVYKNMTIEELTKRLNKYLNSTLKNKGKLIATYSIENKVDPVLATSIILHETGCKWNCSYLVKKCNNVAGIKGKPGCAGMNSYRKFNNIDEGIKFFIRYLKNNYYAYGMNTAKKMEKKYSGNSKNWAQKVNYYVNLING